MCIRDRWWNAQPKINEVQSCSHGKSQRACSRRCNNSSQPQWFFAEHSTKTMMFVYRYVDKYTRSNFSFCRFCVTYDYTEIWRVQATRFVPCADTHYPTPCNNATQMNNFCLICRTITSRGALLCKISRRVIFASFNFPKKCIQNNLSAKNQKRGRSAPCGARRSCQRGGGSSYVH